MINRLIEIFFYPYSARWEKDYDAGIDTARKSIYSGVATGGMLGFIVSLIMVIH